MTKTVFKLRQFEVAHGNSSMKVGTDAMILGSIVQSNQPKTILDIGTGSGILALMMAQRFPSAKISAIDIHENSILEAQSNFKNSPFKNVDAQKISLQEFALSKSQKFDLIISNPPFFKDDLKSNKDSRNFARHNDTLSFDELISNAQKLLTEKGLFWFILPERYHNEIQKIASLHNLYIHDLTSLHNDNQELPVRFIYSLSFVEKTTIKRKLQIRINGKYSADYIQLTKEFHDREL